MKIEKIKPVPKYIVERVRRYDKENLTCAPGHTRFYSYLTKNDGETLTDFLNNRVFADGEVYTLEPDAADVEGFNTFAARYSKGLPIEKAAVENMD